MKLKQTLTALIIATTLVTNGNAANAFGWNMSWFFFGHSPGGIVLNGTSLTGANPKSDRLRAKTEHRITSVTPPVIINPDPAPIKFPLSLPPLK